MTETTNTETTTEKVTEKVTLEALAGREGYDPFLSNVWSQLDGTRNAMAEISKNLDKYTPPSAMEVYKYATESDDAQIKEYLENVKKLEAKTAELRAAMSKRAKELLQPESISDEDLAKMRGEFQTKREIVNGQLVALKTYAQAMGKEELAEAVDNFSVPRFARGLGATSGTNAPRNTEAAACRKWANENGHTVPEKGRIPAEVWDAYRKATAS